jgi:hypothetical protein
MLNILFSLNIPGSLPAQVPDPVQSIKDLKEGYLIIRMPASKPKIDTLRAMISRSTDEPNTVRLQKQLDEAIQERDTLISDYTRAFRNVYHFSKAGYYFDYEGHDLNAAHYYHLDSTDLTRKELSLGPVFYLHFERAKEGNVEALVIHDASGAIIPKPFPNYFSLSGINALFLKFSQKTFAEWRVEKMNKKLNKYWKEVGIR